LVAFSVLGALYGWYEYKRRQRAESPKVPRAKPQVRRRTA
jgi:hypothetical protein